jgi:XTP/dITP diphosphohydrolase
MLYYITGNQNKIDVAKQFLDPLGLSFEPHPLELIEIQSHSIEEIAIYKAKQAFEKLNQPLFVNDHGWAITALNGFPGAYMKYMNEWLTGEDFLHLMSGKENREAILTEVVCYIDSGSLKTFTALHKGIVLHEKKGSGPPGMTTISLSKDNMSIAEKMQKNPSAIEEYSLWKEFAEWYKELRTKD